MGKFGREGGRVTKNFGGEMDGKYFRECCNFLHGNQDDESSKGNSSLLDIFIIAGSLRVSLFI